MTTQRETDAYFICATPRTGSTLLCELLTSTQVAGVPESYFRSPDEPSWAERFGLRGASLDYRAFVQSAKEVGST